MVNKISLFTLCLFLTSIFCVSQNTFIPDDNFEQALIDLGYDSGALDDFVPTANINTVTNLDIASKNISDITGIEDFTALSILNCQENSLINIDISQNTNLLQLFCGNNQLTSLDVTNNTSLSILWCDFNQLSGLNIDNNPNLISLTCGNNILDSLNTSKNLNLTVIVCENNRLIALDVTNNTKLNRLQCGGNSITSLDVTQNASLSFLDCETNHLSVLDVSLNPLLSYLNCGVNNIKDLDLSKNSFLSSIDCRLNNLCLLNIKNGNNQNITFLDFSFNFFLNCVVVDNSSNIVFDFTPSFFTNFVSSQNICNNFTQVDNFADVITTSFFTLPALSSGNYFTESNGGGVMLSQGDIISSSKTIYIFNQTACGTEESSFNVLIIEDVEYFIPKYFTPNNDGSHDYWQVIDMSNTIKFINIYNRYGKLLKSLRPSQGWDGYYRGKPMQTSDYWYIITLNSGEILKGHFALKR